MRQEICSLVPAEQQPCCVTSGRSLYLSGHNVLLCINEGAGPYLLLKISEFSLKCSTDPLAVATWRCGEGRLPATLGFSIVID